MVYVVGLPCMHTLGKVIGYIALQLNSEHNEEENFEEEEKLHSEILTGSPKFAKCPIAKILTKASVKISCMKEAHSRTHTANEKLNHHIQPRMVGLAMTYEFSYKLSRV